MTVRLETIRAGRIPQPALPEQSDPAPLLQEIARRHLDRLVLQRAGMGEGPTHQERHFGIHEHAQGAPIERRGVGRDFVLEGRGDGGG